MQEHLGVDHEDTEVENEDEVVSDLTNEYYRSMAGEEPEQTNCSKRDLAEALKQLKKELQTPRMMIKEPKLVDPEYFEGDWDKMDLFRTSLETCFQLQPSRFSLESQKIAYTSLFLHGRAQNWWLKERPTWCPGPGGPEKSWRDFMAEMSDAFGEQYKRADALKELQTLTQTGEHISINNYLNRMQRLN